MKRPKKGEYAPMHGTYLSELPKRGSALSLLRKTFRESRELLGSLPDTTGNFRYMPDKWTLKQVIAHLIDFERVFAFRILSFMRADRIGLPGFNQDFWMEEVDVSGRSIKDLLNEWKPVRDNTIFLLRQCTEKQATFLGTASGLKCTPRALFFVLIGHHIHHLRTLRELYLNQKDSTRSDHDPEVGA
ncbi:MAG: DinB family protein [Saprospiraceae bacterium]